MTDPAVQSFKRPLYESEVNDFGLMNLNENRFNFGIFFWDKKTKKVFQVPEEIGTIVISQINTGLHEDGASKTE